MKAMVYTEYGSPDVLKLTEVEKPTPKADEVLVKVRASALNSADLDYLRGMFLIRLGSWQKPVYRILGTDIAGVVEAVGTNVKQFQVGDEVFGDLTEHGFGAFAEYVCVPEAAIALKPANLTFEDAAAIPTAGVIALQGIGYRGQLQAGQKILINGAGGGAGTLAIQLAKQYGVEITAVDSAPKLDLLRSLGADHVIDYQKTDYTRNGQRYDLVLDVIAKRSIFDYRRALTPTGTFGMVGGTVSAIMQGFFLGAWLSRNSQQKLGVVMVQPKQSDLNTLREFVEAGKLTPIIDSRYPLSEIAEGLRKLEAGRVLGKVVISVE